MEFIEILVSPNAVGGLLVVAFMKKLHLLFQFPTTTMSSNGINQGNKQTHTHAHTDVNKRASSTSSNGSTAVVVVVHRQNVEIITLIVANVVVVVVVFIITRNS